MGLYRDASGSQKSAGSYPTEKEALKAARLAEAGGYVGKTQTVFAGKVRRQATVASYAFSWLPGHALSPHARSTYDNILKVHVLPALGNRPLAAVTSADIREWFRRLEAQGASGALLAKVKTVASSMFQAACEDRQITYNPVRGVRYTAAPVQRRRALTNDEWLAVRRYLTGEYRLLADVIMDTGARIEECRGMLAEDITDGVWHVCRTRNEVHGKFIDRDMTKTVKTRYIELDPELAEKLTSMGPGRVFGDFHREAFRVHHWQRACKAAGLDWTPAPRDLRRTFAALLREAGADLETTRVAMGHAHLSTTDIYLPERASTRTSVRSFIKKRALKGAA